MAVEDIHTCLQFVQAARPLRQTRLAIAAAAAAVAVGSTLLDAVGTALDVVRIVVVAAE
jgi:hypothetical protein